jgi:hypothetical protein
MVETSLVLLVALALIIGIMDLGQILFLRQSVQERVRAALRAGVITYDPESIKNIVLYGKADPPDGARPSFHLTSAMVSVTRLNANESSDRIKISVTNYPIDFYTPLMAKRVVGRPIVAVLAMEAGNLP